MLTSSRPLGGTKVHGFILYSPSCHELRCLEATLTMLKCLSNGFVVLNVCDVLESSLCFWSDNTDYAVLWKHLVLREFHDVVELFDYTVKNIV